MIHATVRGALRREDAQLVLRLLAGGDATAYTHAEELLADLGIDALLDDPRLPALLRQRRQGIGASLPLFCYVVVRHALRAAGEGDRRLADYLAWLVLHFGLRDRACRIADHDDEIYTSLAEILAAAEDAERRPDPRRSFLARAHLGNYALWLSGLFPDHVDGRAWRRGGPDLEYYESLGRRGYQLAAEHRLAAEHGMASLFAAAAERFTVLRAALNEVSDTLLFPHHTTPERLMRQVRDADRWRHAG